MKKFLKEGKSPREDERKGGNQKGLKVKDLDGRMTKKKMGRKTKKYKENLLFIRLINNKLEQDQDITSSMTFKNSICNQTMLF